MGKLISISDDGACLSSEPLTSADYINITLTTQMNLFNHLVDNAPEDAKTKLKEDLYDLFNEAASAFLAAFAPEIELRPDLTAEAILKAENEILDENAKTEKAAPKVVKFPKSKGGK
jgi:hypothetical protein